MLEPLKASMKSGRGGVGGDFPLYSQCSLITFLR